MSYRKQPEAPPLFSPTISSGCLQVRRHVQFVSHLVELEKHGDYSLAYEGTYDGKAIISAISKGKEALILTLRTTSFYPLGVYAEKIAAAVMNLYGSENNQSVELYFDDKDYFYARFEP
ncbi:MAG: hypothetical protein JRJ46_07400 [Deltaproteobacteria bacterium]|nr:hypothetical protein [Deltaproteobacteria bacterium]